MKDITIRISGSITIGEGDIQIHNFVRKAIDDDYDIIVLDLGKVSYMDSAAVGEIAASFTSCKNKNRTFALANMPPNIKKIMEVMCFLDLVPNFGSVEDALQILRQRHKEKKS